MAIKKKPNLDDDTLVIPTAAACYDCGGKFLLQVHLTNGRAIRTETDNGEEPQLRACARGRAHCIGLIESR